MTPLQFAFRKLLLRNIPKLTSDDLDRYDNLLALRADYIHQLQLNSLPEEIIVHVKKSPIRKIVDLSKKIKATLQQAIPRNDLIDAVKISSDEVHQVIEPHRVRFEALHRLWIARRQLAAHQGNLLQIPTTLEGVKHLGEAIIDNTIVEIQTTRTLVKEKIRDLLKNKKKLVIVCFLILILILCLLWFFLPKPGLK